MNREQVDYFVLAYDSRSFAAAAAKVPMSSQGFTKAVHALEHELGVSLFTFDEDGSRHPTPYADELYLFARRFQNEYGKLLETFERIRADERTVIHLNASLGILGLLGTGFLDGFSKRNPRIDIELQEVSDIVCDDALVDGECDLALSIYPYDTRVLTTELYRSTMCFWMKTDNPLAAKEQLAWEDLAGCRIAIPGKGFKCLRTIRAACAERDIPLGEVVDSPEIFWIYEFARSGRGLGFTVPHIAELAAFRSDPAMTYRPLADAPWCFGISWLPSHEPSAQERSFADYCSTYIKRHLGALKR